MADLSLDGSSAHSLLSDFLPITQLDQDHFLAWSADGLRPALVNRLALSRPGQWKVSAPRPDLRLLTAWLHLTDRCNLRCEYCYLPHRSAEMTLETGRASIAASFSSAQKHGYTRVKLKYAGGEPLLAFPLLVDLQEYALSLSRSSGIDLDGVVLTNGTLLNTGMIDQMKVLNLRLVISLDGLGRYHDSQRPYAGGRGSWKDVSESIELAQSHGLTPEVPITVSGRSAAGLPDVVSWLLERDLPFSLNFYRENDLSSAKEDLKLEEETIIRSLLAAFERIEAGLPSRSLLAALADRANLSVPHTRACGVGENYLVFGPDGRLSQCPMRIDDSVEWMPGMDPVVSIRSSAAIPALPVDAREGCSACRWRYWCAGGCPLSTYRATGRYDTRSPYCNIYQAIFPEVLRLEGLRLLKYQDDPQVTQKIVA